MNAMASDPSTVPPRFARQAAPALAVLFLLAFGAYLRTLSPAFHPDDSPETISAGATLGIQHPPGYPLHSLLGRLAVLLGPGPAPFNVNLLSALAGAAAAVLAACVLFTLCLEFAPWAAQRRQAGAFALAGGLAAAATQTLWFQSTIAKGGIYSLNIALTLATLLAVLRTRDAWLSAPSAASASGGRSPGKGRLAPPLAGPLPGAAALALAGLLFGLGMANHWTSQVVLLPAYGLLLAGPLLQGRRPAVLGRLDALLAVPALAALAGLALYLYLPLRGPRSALVWGDASSWQGFWWLFSRGQYADIEASKSLRAFLVLLQRMGQDLAADWTLPGLAVLAGGWALLLRKRPALGLALLALPLGLAFAVAWKANPPADSLFIIDPYLVPLHVGLGLGLAGWFALPRPRTWLALPLLAGALALGASQWRACDHGDDFLGWDYANNLLLGAPRGALLFCEGDSNTASPLALTLVLGKRRDLTPIASVLLDYPWYRAALKRMDPDLKLPPFAQGPAADMAWMAQANAPRPSLWTNSYHKEWLDSNRLLPRGLLFAPSATPKPFSPALLAANRIWAAWPLRGAFEPGARDMDPITVRLVRDNYVAAGASLGAAYSDSRAWDQAAEEDRRLGVLRPGWAAPWLLAGTQEWYKGDQARAGALWQRAAKEEPASGEAWSDLGLVAYKQGRSAEAEQLATKALALNPGLDNARSLLALLRPGAGAAAAQGAAAGQAPGQAQGPGQPQAQGQMQVQASTPGALAASEGDSLAKAGRNAEALAAYDKAMRLGFTNSALLRNRGLMLGQLGKVDQAVASLQQAAALDPRNPELVKMQGYFIFNAGRRKEGLVLLEKALAMAPADADLRRLVADAKKKAGVP